MMKFLGLSGAIVVSMASVALAQPLGTSFTYQGELRSAGVPAAGLHDLRFRLYDAATGGTQIGAMLCSDNVTLNEGRFTAVLDFGAQFAGQQRFLEIEVRQDTGLACANPAGFTILGPRVALTATPNAAFALNAANATNAVNATSAVVATNATQLNGQGASFYQNAENLSAGTIPDGRLSGTYSGTIALSNVGNTINGTHSGSGAGLTGLNASNIASGTLSAARLPIPLMLSGGTSSIVEGISSHFSGAGIIGRSTSITGLTYGGLFTNTSPEGRGVFAETTATSGLAIAGEFRSSSSIGRGVVGWAMSPTGLTYGLVGQSDSDSGVGISGYASSPSGATQGGRFISNSTSGRGVYGETLSTTGNAYAGEFRSASNLGIGVLARATSATGNNYGVWGQSASTTGNGVFGLANASTGANYGVRGQSDSNAGSGVWGYASAASGETFGGRFQSDSPDGRGVYGLAASTANGTAAGVWGQSYAAQGTGVAGLGLSRGVWGSSGASVFGTAFNSGGYFESLGAQGYGVYGVNYGPTDGQGIGVYGVTGSYNGAGVHGHYSTTGPGPGDGGRFTTYAQAGRGLFAQTLNENGLSYAVYAQGMSTQGYAGYFTGVGPDSLRVLNTSSGRGMLVTALTDTAIWATTNSGFAGIDTRNAGTTGYGLFALASATTGTNYGVFGQSNSAAGWGVWAQGRSGASGTKSFRIDHPADPENKYLLHYSAESPEVINFYSGKVTLDEAGEAVVELPAYFARVNKDPRYTLTAVGAPMPMLHVAVEISEAMLAAGEKAAPGEDVPTCYFRISGGAPGAKVSWRVEAIRNDLWMRNRASPVEADKQGPEKGTYQHPEFYGLPAERGINADHRSPPAPVEPAQAE